MGRTLLLLVSLLFFSKSFGLDPDLINNQWHLEKIVVSGEEIVPPVNEELPNVLLFFEDSGTGLNFWSFVCNVLNGVPEFSGGDSFSFSELYQSLGGCDDPTNTPFELQYFQFYFSNDIGEPYVYEIVDEGIGGMRMTVTVQNGDVAYYQNSVLGIHSVQAIPILMYPNPANDQIYIETDLPLNKLEIYTTTGKLLHSQNNPTPSLDISTLPTGLYFMKVYQGDRVSTQKFVKR
ncbi:T9SS type A sorting domain-containing protein [Marinirhabdus gelatinilytica]|uniref:Putative secreted protein (Por secretion system target) n=1 Tax=Marinirhabdus gelatinilytica TaxID=1703343 RepID=A0A370QIY5_9FLAO|nr:T9SS type A sorting domain-containing protein [Marinirhabdus gelatinilytica]RDK88318.1 putative secreted protein (Por secretion system target) [Marinirhabdus gelatinilytica]